jgi:hypothetical protein
MALRLSGDGRITGVDTALTGLITDAGGGIIQPDDPSVIPLTLAGASGQTANLFEVKDNDDNIVVNVEPDGDLIVAGDIEFNGNDLAEELFLKSPSASPNFTGQVVVPNGTASAPSISPSGDINTGLFFPAADTIAFSEGGVEAMRIDSSGRVTTPYQPSFYAYGSGSLSVSGTSQLRIIELANTYNNVGSHFNTSTFKFTAPIAGTYLFFGRATTSTATSTGPALFINVNNGSFALEVAINYSNINFTAFSGMMIQTLQANDSVELSINNYNNTSFTLDRGRCSLSGFLIG